MDTVDSLQYEQNEISWKNCLRQIFTILISPKIEQKKQDHSNHDLHYPLSYMTSNGQDLFDLCPMCYLHSKNEK